MGLEDDVRKLRSDAMEAGIDPVPQAHQGVGKDRIKAALNHLGLATPDMIDGVFALLDDQHESWFSKPPAGARFCDGATTAHLGCHIGILQRGESKLDREGRDYWIKPLRSLGAIEAIYLDKKTRGFIPGHPVAKSPNSAYRLAPSFKEILTASEGRWGRLLEKWWSEDVKRERLEFQARLEREAAKNVEGKHANLIAACIKHYVPRFLPHYVVLYKDDADGDRISSEERELLDSAGIELTLADAMPDVLLWNEDTDHLWIIEAVTSDGEVDSHKVAQVQKLVKRSGKAGAGFTTAYDTWRRAAGRQKAHKNIAPGTYVWILEDPSKHFLAESWPVGDD